MERCFIDGNEAVARAAMAAGCRFFAGYPITPATSIYNAMLKMLPPAGGVCLQAEDEIAAIGFCLGASMAGLKAMTATSGPGISLYSEQISFAIGSEIPLVIVDVQRLGPSTGSATRGADGDVQFLRWGNSGGLPVIVLAPEDAADCYRLTLHAFNMAETYRCPVFLASNKEVALTRESVDLHLLQGPEPVERRRCPHERPYLPFAEPSDRKVPDFVPIGDRRLSRQTSSTHGPDGYITVDPDQIQRNQDRLMEKILDDANALALVEEYRFDEADTLVVCYGVTARAARQAQHKAASQGRPFSLLVLKTLWPVPQAAIAEAARDHKKVVVVEMNQGQYVREVARLVAPKPLAFFGQMNGELIAPETVMEVACR